MRSTKGPLFSLREGLVSHCPSGHSINPPLSEYWFLSCSSYDGLDTQQSIIQLLFYAVFVCYMQLLCP